MFVNIKIIIVVIVIILRCTFEEQSIKRRNKSLIYIPSGAIRINHMHMRHACISIFAL